MTAFLRLCLLLLLPLLTPACEKEPLDTLDELVPATQEGANTLGCLIDGEVFYNRGGSLNVRDITSTLVTTQPSRIGIVGHDVSQSDAQNWSRVFVNVPIPFLNPNIYTGSVLGFNRGIGANAVDSFVDASMYNSINVEFYDMENRIVSGTFEFTVIEEGTGTVRTITNGRFDVKYQ